jgi:trans-aconitate 2-methyltransferase
LRGTTLLPYLALLDAASRTAFLDALGPRLLEAYPSSPAGITLFPFRRFFILAQR